MDNELSFPRLLFGLCVLIFFGWAALEYWTLAEQARISDGDPVSVMSPGELRIAEPYLALRARFMLRWWLYAPLVIGVPILIFVGARRFAAWNSTWRARVAGMDFKKESDRLINPLAKPNATVDQITAATQQAFVKALHELGERSEKYVVVGLNEEGGAVYASDRQRGMHMQVLGQTGSGKTASVLYPLMYQDARRLWLDRRTNKKVHRTVMLIDAKGSIENEHALTAIAGATGRLANHRIFSLNPSGNTHTYNPLYVSPNDDPKQVAERVFSSFSEDLTEGYFRDMAYALFTTTVVAFASSGKQMTLKDLLAAFSDPDIMAHALTLCKDRGAVNTIQASYNGLGDKFMQTYSGLLSALSKYDHPAINSYNPDIVLDRLFEEGAIVGFSLSANAFKFQAKAIGLVVLQHVQQIGAQRQLDRSISQCPAYIYADEFFNFAYAGFIDAINKLRDANLAMILAHQSMSDLVGVSPEFAQGVWDNTRNRIALYQSDNDFCDRIAGGVGTQKNIVQTIRRSADAFLNSENMMEASSREVDEYVLHPNRIKVLKTGQAYMVQSGIAEDDHPGMTAGKENNDTSTVAVGLNLPLMLDLPTTDLPPPAEPDTTSGIGLYNMFASK